MKSPNEVAKGIAKRAKSKRLSLNFKQKTLSEKSGVKYATLKKFEQTGEISLKSLLKIALVLGDFKIFEDLFVKNMELPSSLDKLLEENIRRRGRK